MRLRGIQFGPVLGASGVQGWFGEGYPYHRYLKPIGLNFDGMTLVAKTTTLNARQGNMSLLQDGITPKGLKPKCIHMTLRSWLQGVALNAVGLSGPGASDLLNRGIWQRHPWPLMLSFMSVEVRPEDRLRELRDFLKLLKAAQPDFKARFGLQVNFSCPNVGINPDMLVGEIEAALLLCRDALPDVPIIPKINVLMPPETLLKVPEGLYDAVCVTNTIPYGKDLRIDWGRYFGYRYETTPADEAFQGFSSDRPVVVRRHAESPLAEFGGGGLSGKPLLPLVCAWITHAREIGMEAPINAGGGILRPADLNKLSDAGLDLKHDSVFLGSVAFLRPWRLRRIIKHAQRLSQRPDPL